MLDGDKITIPQAHNQHWSHQELQIQCKRQLRKSKFFQGNLPTWISEKRFLFEVITSIKRKIQNLKEFLNSASGNLRVFSGRFWTGTWNIFISAENKMAFNRIITLIGRSGFSFKFFNWDYQHLNKKNTFKKLKRRKRRNIQAVLAVEIMIWQGQNKSSCQ